VHANDLALRGHRQHVAGRSHEEPGDSTGAPCVSARASRLRTRAPLAGPRVDPHDLPGGEPERAEDGSAEDQVAADQRRARGLDRERGPVNRGPPSLEREVTSVRLPVCGSTRNTLSDCKTSSVPALSRAMFRTPRKCCPDPRPAPETSVRSPVAVSSLRTPRRHTSVANTPPASLATPVAHCSGRPLPIGPPESSVRVPLAGAIRSSDPCSESQRTAVPAASTARPWGVLKAVAAGYRVRDHHPICGSTRSS
jgi:hypothetical protein